MLSDLESESSRVPSPWDPFLPSPPSGCSADSLKHIHDGVPKLLPEVEEGNVEYKLKLTHISTARFARLVTQLKWRLLEGGGQAYYELGVADSGALIGLSRADLEASLETLDRMAGEIGASVIVVKEIEVPPAMYALAEEASRYIDPRTGEWAGRMHARRRGSPLTGADDDTAATETTETETETETELDTTDMDDDDDASPSAFISELATPADSSRASPMPGLPVPDSFVHRITTHPNRPSPQSSPYIAPFDDDLAMFSMEPEPPHLDIDTGHGTAPATVLSPIPFVVDLEIASVYKPRPFRRSVPVPVHSGPVTLHGRAGRRAKYTDKGAGKEKKAHPWQTGSTVPTTRKGNASADAVTGTSASIVIPNGEETKAALRRQARERRREEKRQALLAASGFAPSSSTATSAETTSPIRQDDSTILPTASLIGPDDLTAEATSVAAEAMAEDLISGLVSLHVGVEPSEPADIGLDAVVSIVEADSPGTTTDVTVAQATATAVHAREPRLIVEALVVRKQSIDQTFGDFGGFQFV
ncbi:uncharacterized protein B0H18DRAFT_1055100 [Fomitopsis serialis]|uniref:uncharacterized protein n=1 Tax=Fomitopsis serialis TaxID=139415 RepID=UPI002007AC1C|nr:uncharacterized protein B0H18DRAFT_1055100 [Neoantrodia serialis]KAH9912219.1 hypothetical protein B0H18DRAFT_1055100 [Neoantrodia serialis]